MQISHNMSAKHKNCMIWTRSEDWYYVDEERDRFVLTPKAPPEAHRSFEEFKKLNNVKWDD